jgi:hypothetical protein
VPQFPQNVPAEIFVPHWGQAVGSAFAAGLPHSGQNLEEPTSAPQLPHRHLAAWVFVAAVGVAIWAPGAMSTPLA